MKYTRILILLSACTGILTLPGYAQKKGYNEEITVVAPYQPDIKDANKINFSPSGKDTTLPKPGFTYKIVSKPAATVYQPGPIEAAKMLKEPIRKLYRHYAKAGYGSYYSPYGEYFYQNTRSKEVAYGAHARHWSSTGKIKDYAYPGFSENEVSVFGKYFKDKKFILSGDLGFDRDVVHYYGFIPDDFPTLTAPAKIDLKQRFSKLYMNADWKSTYSDSTDLTWRSSLKFYHLSDRNDTRETNILLNGGIGKTGKFVDLSPSQTWDLGLTLDLYNDKSKVADNHTSALLILAPSVQTKIKDLGIHIGLKPAIEADSNASLHLYPDIRLSFRAIPWWLNLYAGIDGGIERNSYLKFTNENPFVNPGITLSYKNTKYRFFAGVNSTLFRMIDLHFEISKAQIENMPFFVNDTSLPFQNQFLAMYDEDAGLFELKTELAWQMNESFRSMFRFNYHQYSTSFKSAQPWHRPNYDLSLSLLYSMQQKIIAGIDFIYYDEMYALAWSLRNGKPIFDPVYVRNRPDLNISLEYRYTKMFSFFVKANNLANVRYYYWNNYPSWKLNVLGGITCSF